MDNSSERSLARDACLVLVLAILLGGLVLSSFWSQTKLIGTFYSAFFVHAGFTLYDGRFNALRTKTWLLLLASWTLAEISPFFSYFALWGARDFWTTTALVNLEAAGWHHWAAALMAILRMLSFWPVALLVILCADIAVMHRRSWNWIPAWRACVFIACVSLGGLALGLVSGTLMPSNVPSSAPVDPLRVPAAVVPEWFRLPYYAILRIVPYKVGGLAAMFAAMLAPMVWPWMRVDTLRIGPLRQLWVLICIFLAATWIGLAYLGSRPAEPGTTFAARALLTYYFAFFLILPPMLHSFSRRPAA